MYGLIFTFMWDFDLPQDWDSVRHVNDIFQAANAEVYYAELVTSREVRLQRNTTENRLRHKPSKRDVEASARRLLDGDTLRRCISRDGEIPFANYIKIDNTHVPPEDAAAMIQERFAL